MKVIRFLENGTLVAVLAASVFTTGCGGAGSSNGPGPPPGPLTVSLSTSRVVSPHDGTPGPVVVTASGAKTASSVAIAASNLPSGVTSQFAPASDGLSGTLSFVAGSATPAGTYSARAGRTTRTRPTTQRVG